MISAPQPSPVFQNVKNNLLTKFFLITGVQTESLQRSYAVLKATTSKQHQLVIRYYMDLSFSSVRPFCSLSMTLSSPPLLSCLSSTWNFSADCMFCQQLILQKRREIVWLAAGTSLWHQWGRVATQPRVQLHRLLLQMTSSRQRWQRRHLGQGKRKSLKY